MLSYPGLLHSIYLLMQMLDFTFISIIFHPVGFRSVSRNVIKPWFCSSRGYNFPALLPWTLLLLLYIWMANDVYLTLRRDVKARDIFFKLPLREYSLPDIVLCIHYLILSLHWASENRYEYLTLWMRTVRGKGQRWRYPVLWGISQSPVSVMTEHADAPRHTSSVSFTPW